MQPSTKTSNKLKGYRVIIDPWKSLSARVFDVDEELIQFQALVEVNKHVVATLARVDEFVDELEKQRRMPPGASYRRVHDAILVDGSRGSGKSSFLLSVIDFMCGDAGNHSRLCTPPQKRLCSLGIIDPTMVTSKEHIFILIISKIRDLVEQELKNNSAYRRDSIDRKGWDDSLNALSRGLCMLDGVGKEPLKQIEWEDSQYVVREGLANALGGVMLERNFHYFILESLRLLNKDAFLLGLDDIDTNFDSGWPVLEILRKYLTTPQLVIMISGDYALYSKLVCRQQWRSFQKRRELIQHVGWQDIKSTVQRLESQYLTKILRPERRVTLKGIWELIENIYVVPPHSRNNVKKKNEINVNFLLQAFTELWYMFPSSVSGRMGEHIAHLSLRNLVNLLLVIDNDGRAYSGGVGGPGVQGATGTTVKNRSYILAKHISDVYEKKKKGGAKGRQPINNTKLNVLRDEVNVMHYEIIRVMRSRLISMGFTQDDLHAVQWTGKLDKITKILNERNLLKNGACLLPSNVMLPDGLLVLVLSGICMSAMASDIKHALHYYVRVLMVRDCLAHLESNVPDEELRDGRLVEALMSPSNSLQDVAVAIVRAYYERLNSTHLEKVVSLAGLVEVCPFPRDSGEFSWLEYLYNAMVMQFSDSGAENQGKTKYYFSPLNMVAVLGMCVGTTGDLDFELRRMRAPRIINPRVDDVAYMRKHLPPVLKDDANEMFVDFARDVHEWAREYYGIYEGRFLLPPYFHADVWADFMSGLNARMTIVDVCSCYKDAVKRNEAVFNEARSEQNEFHKFISESPLWPMIKKMCILIGGCPEM